MDPDNPPGSPLRERRIARVRGMLARRLGSVVVIVEAVRRRHNASAILRSCEAFGVHEVHLVTGDFSPSKGAARGAERWLELHRHEEVSACIAALKARGFRVYVADLAEDAYAPDEVPVEGPVAVLFGSELTGVSDAARALADGVVSVPMRGLTESLNVGSAAACTIFRLAERRRALVARGSPGGGGEGDLAPERQEAFLAAWQEAEEAARAGRRARKALKRARKGPLTVGGRHGEE